MTAENLLQFLQHPQNLRRVSYQELKTLALEYPYSTHIHQLLLLKSKLSDQKDFSADLARAAASSPDRNHLRQLLLEFEHELQRTAQPREDFFELKPPAEVEELLAGIRATQEPSSREDTPPLLTFEAPRHPEILSHEPSHPEVSDDNPATENPIEKAAEIAKSFPNEEVQGSVPEPLDKTAFRSWNHHQRQMAFRPPRPTATDIHSVRQISPTPEAEPVSGSTPGDEPPVENSGNLHHLAEVSIEERQEVASETLAALLARQGNIQKAIEMYERLILKFPEKSTFFAAQIENLKK